MDKREPGTAKRSKRVKELRVYKDWCKRCGICVSFCPKEALEKDSRGYPKWREKEACVLCRLCELRCPDFAIEVVEDGGKEENGRRGREEAKAHSGQ